MSHSAKLARIAKTSPTGTYADIANNGIALLKAGYYPAAELYLTRAIELNPALYDLYCDLALAFSFNNKPYHALAVGFEALKILPDQFMNFSWILQQVVVAKHNPLYRQVLEYLLDKNLFSDALSGVFYQILTSDPRYDDITLAQTEPQKALQAIDNVMCHVLCLAPVTMPTLELALTSLRDYLANNPASDPANDPYKNIRASLIAQGLMNEYAWATPNTLPQTNFERFMYEDISAHNLKDADAILAQIDFPPARHMIADHLEFRTQFEALAASTPSFRDIDDETSKLVRAQYEENPYPRWTQAARKHIGKSSHPMPAINKVLSEANNMLIAGCGTGQQILFVHDSYTKAKITAFDLSRASMAYAKYRLNSLNVPLPEMYQGDILNVADLQRSFDVIECSGVLHHMQNPLAGLDCLLDSLKPGGYLHLGLYSALARADIYKTRAHIARKDYSSNLEGIRACRQDVLTVPDMYSSFLINSRDFYVTSTCRDLIFHVQEHSYTIIELQEILAARGLEFLGFEIQNPASLANFYAVNGSDADLLSFENWNRLEQNYPKTFRSMYNFWVRKPIAH